MTGIKLLIWTSILQSINSYPMCSRSFIHALKATLLFISVTGVLVGCSDQTVEKHDYTGWKTYAGTKDAMRFSANDQITRQNINQLKVAWTYSSGDKDSLNRSQNQCNPIVVDEILFGTSGTRGHRRRDPVRRQREFCPATAYRRTGRCGRRAGGAADVSAQPPHVHPAALTPAA